MTTQEKKRVIEIYGPNYERLDIPAYIRIRDLKVKSECCGARMLELGQCEACGSDGKIVEGSAEYPLGGMIEPYDIVTENELTDMFGEGGKEEVKEHYHENL